MKRSLITPLALALVAVSTGCSVYQPLRDTTQPMKFKKTALNDGDDWYMMTTVIDAPYEAGFTFPGESGKMTKIKWVIEKDYLYAYNALELVRDAEFANSREDFMGEPVAAYRIEKHFDVWKQYNPVTGEEMPVLYEAVERPWWEREWIRVDWSTNHINGFEYMGSEICQETGSIRSDPVGYYPTQPTDPEQFYVGLRGKTEADIQKESWYADFQERFPDESFCTQSGDWCNVYGWDRIEYLGGDQPFDYMDVVNREVVHMDLVSPVDINCLSYPTWQLGGMQVTYRRSFMRKKPSSFKPVYHPDRAFEKFGFFRTERAVFDPERGISDYKDYNAQIWNLWDNRYNEDGSEKPVDEWTLRPITYYYVPTDRLPSTKACLKSGEACVDYIQDSLYDQVASDWNDVYRGVLASLGRKDAKDATIVQAKPIQYTCGTNHDRACQDIGDLRYSYMWNHDLVAGGSPLGYGPSFADPETGEILSVNANFYGGALRRMSGYLGDLYDISKGNVSEIEIMTGENVREYYQNLGNNILPPRIPQVNLDALKQLAATAKTNALDKTHDANLSFRELSIKNQLTEMERSMPRDRDRRAKIIGSPLEKQLITPEMLSFFGFDPGTPLTDEVLDQVSPLRNISSWKSRSQKWETFWAKHNVLRADADAIFSDYSLDYLIKWAEDSLTAEGITPNRRTVVDFVLRQTFRGVEDHEVGHTMGLRHNFQGSFNSENYRTEYWKIEQEHPDIDFGSISGGSISSSFDANNNGVLEGEELQAFDLAQKTRKVEQEKAGIDLYSFASIMDYSRHFYYNDVVGLSRYDYAALKFAYANKVEIYSEDQAKFDAAAISDAGGWNGFKFQKQNRVNIDYYLGGERCSDDSECPASGFGNFPQHCRLNLGEGAVAPAGSVGTDLGVCSSLHQEMDRAELKLPGQTHLYPHYDFCSDERRGDRPFCNVYDEGKSAQDIIENLEESYQRSYIFNNFRRYKGDTFDPYFYYRRIWNGYYFPMGKIYQSLLYGYYYKPGFVENTGDGGFLDSFLASRMAMNFFAQVLATPDVGSYLKWDPSDNLYEGPYSEDNAGFADIFLPVGLGKHLFSRFEKGYYGEIYRYARIGNFYDKLFAIEALTTRDWGQPQANDETYPINFYDGFQQEMLDLVGGLVSENMDAYSPIIRGVNSDKEVTSLEYRDLWRGGFFGSTAADFSGLESIGSWSTPAAQRYNGEVLDAGGSIYMRLYPLLYSLMDFPVFYDNNFPSYAQMYVYGQPSARDQQAITDGEAAGTLVSFTSPDRAMTFVVPQTDQSRSIFYGVVEKAKAMSQVLETYRGYTAAGGAPSGFAAGHQICGKVYGINPADATADNDCLLQLTSRQESKLESEESFLRLSLDFLDQLGYPVQ